MSLITDITTIITGLYPAATFTLSSKFKANVDSYLTQTSELPLIILNNEIKSDNEIKLNNNVQKNTRIVIMILNLDTVDNTDLQSESIRAAMEVYADKIAVNIYQLANVIPAGRQKYSVNPEFHVFNTNLTGVTLEMNVNYNEVIDFCNT